MKQADNKKNVRSLAGVLITSVVLITSLILFESYIFFSWTPFIWALCFALGMFAYEIIAILILNKKINALHNTNDWQILNLQMLLKMIKMLSFLLVVVVYFVFIKIEPKAFILTVSVIYFVYLVVDVLCLLAIEKRKKKCNEKLD